MTINKISQSTIFNFLLANATIDELEEAFPEDERLTSSEDDEPKIEDEEN